MLVGRERTNFEPFMAQQVSVLSWHNACLNSNARIKPNKTAVLSGWKNCRMFFRFFRVTTSIRRTSERYRAGRIRAISNLVGETNYLLTLEEFHHEASSF